MCKKGVQLNERLLKHFFSFIIVSFKKYSLSLRSLNERLLDTSMSLISSLIAYYHCKSVQYGLSGKMSRSNREAHPKSWF